MVDVVAASIATAAADAKDRRQRNLTPSIEDQEFHVQLGTIAFGDITGSVDYPLMIAQRACKIRSVELVSMTDVVASNTDYWTFGFRKQQSLNPPPAGPAATSLVLSAPDTTAASGKTFNASVPWSANWRYWDPTLITLARQDLFLVRFTPTGSPSPLTRLLVSFRVVTV